MLLVTGLLLLAAPVTYTAVSGQEIVRVDGNSMAPTMQVGDVILISAPRAGEVVKGAVVTVEPPGVGRYTHRVKAVTGETLILQGDANETVDPLPVAIEDVRGVVRHHLSAPSASMLLMINTWPMRLSVAILIIGLLFLPIPAHRQRLPAAVPAAADPEDVDAPGPAAQSSA